MADMYTEAYFNGGVSNYHGYGEDPGWAPTVAVLATFIAPGARMVELGSATGWFLKHASTRFNVTGIDISQWAWDNRVASELLTHGDATDLSSLPDDSVDAVVSWEFLEHLDQPLLDRCLTEQRRVVHAGGFLVHRIGMDLEGDPSWLRYPQDDGVDPTHLTMWPRWQWEEQFAGWSVPVRAHEETFNRTFRDRDWWWRFFVRQVT